MCLFNAIGCYFMWGIAAMIVGLSIVLPLRGLVEIGILPEAWIANDIVTGIIFVVSGIVGLLIVIPMQAKGKKNLCPHCGREFNPHDRFCSRCGEELNRF